MRIFFLKFINFSDSERSEESKALIIKSFRFFASLRMTKREGAFQIYAFLLPHPALSEGEGDR
jgi:hypothetical protein